MTSNNTGRLLPLRSGFLSVAAALVLSLARPAPATVARAVSFDEKVEAADRIVLGRCKTNRSQYDPTGRWIVTTSTFEVKRSFKGPPGGEVTIVTPGGEVGGVHQQTVGIPAFREGEEKVLFVKQSPMGSTVLFADQGAYDVTTNARGDLTIVPASSDLVLIDSQTGRARASSESYRSLGGFETDVNASARRSQQRMLQSTAGRAAQRKIEPKGWLERLLRSIRQNRLMVMLLTAGAILAAIPLLKRR